MPSHRAEMPADSPTVLATRPSAHPPQQRRRDLRAGSGAPPRPSAGLDWLDPDVSVRSASAHQRPAAGRAPLSRRDVHRRLGSAAPASSPSTSSPHRGLPGRDAGVPASFGALALDPLVVPQRSDDDGHVALAAVPEPRAPHTPVRGLPLAPWPLDEILAPPTLAADDVAPTPAATRAAARRAGQTGRSRTTRRAGAPESSGQGAARRPGFGLPQAGIAGALGLATIAVPLTGAFAVAPPAAKPVANSVSAAALQPLPPFPLSASPARTALDVPRLLPDEDADAAVPARLAAPRTLLVGRVSRSNQRAVLPNCDGRVSDTSTLRNGQLPASILCTLWDPSRQLRADAAVAIAKLNIAYQQRFGHVMCFNDAYRSLTQQFRVKAERGGFAARPGTSEHGWGLAVDLCDGVDGGPSSPTYQWMRANAPAYGWQNPAWALPGGAGPYEPWHWEYVPGEKDQSAGD